MDLAEKNGKELTNNIQPPLINTLVPSTSQSTGSLGEMVSLPLKRKRKETGQDGDDKSVRKTSDKQLKTAPGYNKTYEQLLKKECDVKFFFHGTNDRTIGGHQDILSLHSPIFEIMFQKRTKEARTGRVLIKDIRPDVFMELLHWMYTGKFAKTLDEGLAQPLFIAADRYMVDRVKIMCLKFMNRCIRPNNVVPLFAFALKYEFAGLADTKRKCKNFIVNNKSLVRRYCVGKAWDTLIQHHSDLA